MPDDPTVNRREFIIRAAKAGATLAVAGTIGLAARDPQGPGGAPAGSAARRVPDFSIPGADPKMSIVRGADRPQALQLALKAVGGIRSFIRPGDRVVLKVNAAFASPPMLSATSHPLLVAEMASLCFQAGAASVVVTDNPINDPASCFALTGIDRAARSAGAQVVLPEERLFRPVTVKDARLIRDWPVLLGPLAGATKLIGMAPVKDHHRSGASMVLKNWYGLLGGRRNLFHQDIHTIIGELAAMVKPTLVVLDGTTSMMSNGPTGGSLADLKETRTLILGTDPVAVDACGAQLLGKTAADLPFIAKAEGWGAGRADFTALRPIEVQA